MQMKCANNGTTTITGTVYAPNGTDPLPNVTVYIPSAPVAAFTPGVSCPVVGTPPSGSPLVGTVSAVDGSFTLQDVPVGSNIPLVIVAGRWRRQLQVPSITACTNNPLPSSFVVMPQNQVQGDIPLIAIATGSVDQVECVLRKVGIDDSEFTNPGGGGRVNLYQGSNSPGAVIESNTPSQSTLMDDPATLNSYDVLMLPCQGGQFTQPASELANFINFANNGGRVYSSHFSYVWMYNNPPFDGVANWNVNQTTLPDGPATVNTGFTDGQTLAQWLQLPAIDASTSFGQIAVTTNKHDTNGVIAPTQPWLTLNDPAANDPVMQFVFNTPIAPVGQTINQCGRVLYNEYHVENPPSSPRGVVFPNECNSAPMTPQEKLLEYSLFELTNEGGQPSLAPVAQDFGSEAYGFSTAPFTFTWTNNSSFVSQISSATTVGDFSVVSNNCSSVPGGASCQINVVFTPSALGARSGSLLVTSAGNTITASLTGTGVPGFTISQSSAAFGNVDIGATSTQRLTLTNVAPQLLSVPAYLASGPFAVNTAACGSAIAGGSSCTVVVNFSPAATGPMTGALSVSSTGPLYNGLGVTLSGNGVDFALGLSSTSGTVIAGDGITVTATLTPLAGFSAPVTLSCTVVSGVVGSTCGAAAASVNLSSQISDAVTLNTTSQYAVVGYGGFGGRGYLWIVALGSGWLLWAVRRSAASKMRGAIMLLLLAVIGLSIAGCSGKTPTKNSVFTGPGTYTVTVSATDGFLVRSATYVLTVTSQ
jgi:hypothetical protein